MNRHQIYAVARLSSAMLAKLSNYFLLLILGSLCFSPFAIEAQTTAGGCGEGYVHAQIYEQEPIAEQEPWFNPSNGAWQTRTVWKYKSRLVWRCVPIPPKDGSTTSRDERNNSAASTTASDVSSDGTVTAKPSKTLSKQIIEKYNPTQLNSNILAGVLSTDNSRKPSFFTFWSLPGKLTLNLTVEASAQSRGNTILVTLIDPNENSVLGDGEAAIGSRLTTTNYGRITRDVFSVDISERLPILLKIEPYNLGSGHYQIQLDGAIDLGKPDSISKEPSSSDKESPTSKTYDWDEVYKAYEEASNRKQQEYRKTIEDSTVAISRNPNDSSNFLTRGNARYNLEDYRGAVADYTKVIQIYLASEASEEAKKAEGRTGVNFDLLVDRDNASHAYYQRAIAQRYLLGDDFPSCPDFNKSCGLGNDMACNESKKVCDKK